jgi:hypothetical protein
MSVMFGGSRSLSPSAAPLVSAVVSAALSAGRSVSVGCAAGADALVLSAALAVAPSRVSLFCAGSPAGLGFWSGSAPLPLLLSAAPVGASVSWLAGGPLAAPLRARLLRRSLAALAGCSLAVFFLGSPSSPGSLAVAGHAVACGLPVFAFPVGFAGLPACPPGCSGSWLPASLWGFPCLRFAPAQAPLF